MTVDMNADIRRLSGVGSTVGAKLGKLGITTVGSLLYHFPRAYEFRGNIKTVASAEDKETAAFVLTVAAPPSSVRTRSGKMMFRMPAGDGTGGCTITFFNQSYIKYTFAVGASYRFYGKVSRRGKHVELTSPVYEPYSESLLPLYPVYPATEGLTSAKINKLISSLVDREDTVLPENLPEEIIEAEHLMSRTEAVRAIHHPATLEAVNDAKRRLAFEELIQQILLPKLPEPRIRFTAGYSEEKKTADITLLYNGDVFDPADSENTLSYTVVKNMTAEQKHTTDVKEPYTNCFSCFISE